MHTPGPWAVGNEATIYTQDLRTLVAITRGDDVPATEQEANTRLIAALPQLVKALERIANHETRTVRHRHGLVLIEEVNTLRRIARVALRMARGEG